jgi:Family of unknown function (DUF6882)
MNARQFSKFRHEAVHELMGLNDRAEREFKISSWPSWNYDFDAGTLTFSKDGVARVVASIQVVGTTSESSSTWLWSWANSNLPSNVTEAIKKVRSFGEAENITELVKPSAPDAEHLGWEMTAIAAKVIGSTGAYRCPGTNGFVYLVYSDISFAVAERTLDGGFQVKCDAHGVGYQTFVCEHLVAVPTQTWFSDEPNESKQWPDAWCAACNVFFAEQGEWNASNESHLKIKLVCHQCYEMLRSQGQS